MKLEIIKVRLNELEEFVQSTIIQQNSVIPITEMRVKSYVNNPHAQDQDIVLYIGFVQKQLIAFRSLFAGIAGSGKEKQRFAWCSGNWVHPDYRRKGFSEQLLNEALLDWDNKLMFTNYAPNSENLYLKSGKFKSIHKFDGYRAYLFPKTSKLISIANKNKLARAFFSACDTAISMFSSVRLWVFSEKKNPDIRFETIQFPDEECYQLIQNNSSKYLFARGEKELRWIFKYPWITDKYPATDKYPFSSYSRSFSYKTVKVVEKNTMVGFFIFSVRDGNLKTLHFETPDGFYGEIADYLKQYCAKQKIEVITVYKHEVAEQLFVQKFPFLHAKKYGQRIYSSFEIKNMVNPRFQDGDGDVIFT